MADICATQNNANGISITMKLNAITTPDKIKIGLNFLSCVPFKGYSPSRPPRRAAMDSISAFSRAASAAF
jgi:hypothetical protein